MSQQTISRIMARLNLLFKVEDPVVSDTYYLFMKSSKVWADMNFVSVRLQAIENLQIKVSSKKKIVYHLPLTAQKQLDQYLQEIAGNLSAKKCHELAGKELDKVFGIKDFRGKLLVETIDYIEQSKTVNALTHYRHYFFVITHLPEIDRLIGLKTIELVPLSLMQTIQENQGELHESYNPSRLVTEYMHQRIWQKDPNPALKIHRMHQKTRIGVLFSDLKGFGQMVKQFPTVKESQSTQLMLKKYQHLASQEIKAHGGYVIQTAGDAFMAIFALPQDTTDATGDIANILLAAIGMLAIDHILVDGQEMKMTTRIGINIANVDQGFLGALDLREYTVFGKDVNIASRLEKKVDELADNIDHFAGGILFNISNCKEKIPLTAEKQIAPLQRELEKTIQALKASSFKNRLQKIQTELTHNYEIDMVFDRVREKLSPILSKKNKQEKYKYQMSKELQEIRVKEGETKSIFIYKQER
ncbi:MAG: adenylate/guanylate cyclase domain-containing protein [Spirochaetota bacterium]